MACILLGRAGYEAAQGAALMVVSSSKLSREHTPLNLSRGGLVGSYPPQPSTTKLQDSTLSTKPSYLRLIDLCITQL